MAHNFLIAPDFSPERFAGWHMFNTLLQKTLGSSVAPYHARLTR